MNACSVERTTIKMADCEEIVAGHAQRKGKGRERNRPFAGSGHMVRNKLHWDANYAVGLSKQRNSYQSSPTFLCFESPTVIYSVPCDRIVQRAYWKDEEIEMLITL